MTGADTPRTCRVAICDDVDSFRAVLKIVFEFERDIEVVGEASNGQEAIDLVTGTEVDVLLLDLAMPVMDGLEALPAICRMSPDTKVVMLTGFGSDAVRRRAMDAGASRYVEKGAQPNELIEVVRDVFASVPAPQDA